MTIGAIQYTLRSYFITASPTFDDQTDQDLKRDFERNESTILTLQNYLEVEKTTTNSKALKFHEILPTFVNMTDFSQKKIDEIIQKFIKLNGTIDILQTMMKDNTEPLEVVIRVVEDKTIKHKKNQLHILQSELEEKKADRDKAERLMNYYDRTPKLKRLSEKQEQFFLSLNQEVEQLTQVVENLQKEIPTEDLLKAELIVPDMMTALEKSQDQMIRLLAMIKSHLDPIKIKTAFDTLEKRRKLFLQEAEKRHLQLG